MATRLVVWAPLICASLPRCKAEMGESVVGTQDDCVSAEALYPISSREMPSSAEGHAARTVAPHGGLRLLGAPWRRLVSCQSSKASDE